MAENINDTPEIVAKAIFTQYPPRNRNGNEWKPMQHKQ
jgi:ribosomal protein S30